MKVSGKVFLVTGAGSGMGREMTLELVRRGARVAAIDIHETTLHQTQELAGAASSAITLFPCDITDVQAIEKLPAQIANAVGPIDGLINNAGIIQPFVPISQLTREQAQKVMDVNFWGAFTLIKTFLPILSSRPEAHILNVASMGAYAPVPGQSLYGASKAALKLLTEGLRSELLDTKIGVTVAFPGSVATNITENSGIAAPRTSHQAKEFPTLAADKAAKAMIDAIEQKKARITVGKDATMMDRLSRLNPVMAANIIYKQMKSLLAV